MTFTCTCERALRMNSTALAMALNELAVFSPDAPQRILEEVAEQYPHTPTCSKWAVLQEATDKERRRRVKESKL